MATKKATKKKADKKNKGEWGERYCCPKIIHTRQIRFGDKDLNIPDNNNFITVSKLTTADQQQSFSLEPNTSLVAVTKGAGKPESKNLEKIINENTLNNIISEIKKGKTDKATFELPEFKSMEKKLGINFKGGTSSQKADIFLDIEYDGTKKKDVGFSIKSGFGAPPSLLNATAQTNFVYEIPGCSKESLSEVNEITTGQYRIINRIKKIRELGLGFKYANMTSEIFCKNLTEIDKALPELISKMLPQFYINRYDRLSCNLFKLSDFGKDTIKGKTEIKEFLMAIMFGMVPSKEWTRKHQAEGLIVVKGNGDLVCFYEKNFTAGKDYLFEKAYFDTPSRKNANMGKKAGGQEMAELYEKKGKVYINLGLQIRLKF